jgi:hypothetical protein
MTTMSVTCADCEALLGQPATVKPHRGLHDERARVGRDGVLAHFKCRVCGTLWERFEANRWFKRETPVWRLRSVTNQSVWAEPQAAPGRAMNASPRD